MHKSKGEAEIAYFSSSNTLYFCQQNIPLKNGIFSLL